jgi:hypothetical protein
MENTEVLVNGKITERAVYPGVGCLMGCLYVLGDDGYEYFEKQWNDDPVDLPSIRMLTFHRAIMYLEDVIAKQKKCIEEGSDVGTDGEFYGYLFQQASYYRSGAVAWHERKVNVVLQKQANFIQMEKSQYPPFWLSRIRRKREQQIAAETAISKSDYFSRDPDTLLRPLLLASDDEVKGQQYDADNLDRSNIDMVK